MNVTGMKSKKQTNKNNKYSLPCEGFWGLTYAQARKEISEGMDPHQSIHAFVGGSHDLYSCKKGYGYCHFVGQESTQSSAALQRLELKELGTR